MTKSHRYVTIHTPFESWCDINEVEHVHGHWFAEQIDYHIPFQIQTAFTLKLPTCKEEFREYVRMVREELDAFEKILDEADGNPEMVMKEGSITEKL